MKNIRSISIAALSAMLLLSTTASHGMWNFNSFIKTSKDAITSAVNTAQGSYLYKTAVANPYISAAIAATVVLATGILTYKALTKKAAKNNSDSDNKAHKIVISFDESKNEPLKQVMDSDKTNQKLVSVPKKQETPNTFSQRSVKERTKAWENNKPITIEAADDVALTNFAQAISGKIEAISDIINNNTRVELGSEGLKNILKNLQKELSNSGINAERNRKIKDAARRFIDALIIFDEANRSNKDGNNHNAAGWDSDHVEGINNALEALEKLGVLNYL
jgi:hypothetical protein